MINNQRLIDEFIELVKIDSPSSKEGKVAKVLVEKYGISLDILNNNTFPMFDQLFKLYLQKNKNTYRYSFLPELFDIVLEYI